MFKIQRIDKRAIKLAISKAIKCAGADNSNGPETSKPAAVDDFRSRQLSNFTATELTNNTTGTLLTVSSSDEVPKLPGTLPPAKSMIPALKRKPSMEQIPVRLSFSGSPERYHCDTSHPRIADIVASWDDNDKVDEGEVFQGDKADQGHHRAWSHPHEKVNKLIQQKSMPDMDMATKLRCRELATKEYYRQIQEIVPVTSALFSRVIAASDKLAFTSTSQTLRQLKSIETPTVTNPFFFFCCFSPNFSNCCLET